MNMICNILKSWTNFTHLKNARAPLVRQSAGNRKLLKAYLCVLNYIPFLQWEDCVTRLDDIWDNVLFFLAEHLTEIKVFHGSITVEEPSKIYPGQCHPACWHYHQQDSSFEYWLGFCESSHSSSSDWHLHSFLMKDGIVYETTGIPRDRYTGIRIHNPGVLFNFGEFEFSP